MSTAKIVPLTCHGHTRPVTHLSFSGLVDGENYYIISGCKDNNPMLREGITGDWIGTFLGHKGAVWQTRLDETATRAVSASADFSANIWDPSTGECLQKLQHEHIVRSAAFVPDSNAALVATGGFDKKLRIFDLNNVSGASNSANGQGTGTNGTVATVPSYEIGSGIHEGSIQTVVWGPDKNCIVTGSEDRVVRWWDLRSGEKPITTFSVEGLLGSCELSMLSGSSPQDSVLAVAGGKTAYFFSGTTPGQLLKTHQIPFEVASVAVNARERKFVIGGRTEQWVRVYDYDTGSELNVLKGHHGPVWSTAFSPDGKICATGSEDGTIKLWKFTTEPYGLWR